MNDTLTQTEDFATRCQKVLQVARQLFQGNPDWVTFFREVLGVSGAARSVFPSQAEFINFERTTEYSEIQKMVSGLRGRKIPGNSSNEATRVITVRLPESLHEALKAEASDHNTSMNSFASQSCCKSCSKAQSRPVFRSPSEIRSQLRSLSPNQLQRSTQLLRASDQVTHHQHHHLANLLRIRQTGSASNFSSPRDKKPNRWLSV